MHLALQMPTQFIETFLPLMKDDLRLQVAHLHMKIRPQVDQRSEIMYLFKNIASFLKHQLLDLNTRFFSSSMVMKFWSENLLFIKKGKCDLIIEECIHSSTEFEVSSFYWSNSFYSGKIYNYLGYLQGINSLWTHHEFDGLESSILHLCLTVFFFCYFLENSLNFILLIFISWIEFIIEF